MSGSALYITIYNNLLSSIQNGEYPENAQLPSERFFCEKYHVSRSTVREALQLLKENDLIYTIHGNGTFVKPQAFTQHLNKSFLLTDTLKSNDLDIQTQIIQYQLIQTDSHIAHKTKFDKDSQLHMIYHLHSVEEYPLMLETTYLPKSRFIKIDLDAFATESLYNYLHKNYNLGCGHIHETLRPVMPTSEERMYLQIPANTPCMLLERFQYEDSILIEYTKSIIRGDKYILNVHSSPPSTE